MSSKTLKIVSSKTPKLTTKGRGILHLSTHMKALNNFCAKHGYTLHPITYKAQGVNVRRKGYDIRDSSGRILVAFEPQSYTYSAIKWSIHLSNIPKDCPIHYNRLTESALNNIFKLHHKK